MAASLPAGHTPPVPLNVVVHALVAAYQALLSGWLNADVGGKHSAAAMEDFFQAVADPVIS